MTRNRIDNCLTVLAPNERLGRLYIGALIAAGIEIQTSPIDVRPNISVNLLPWKRFPELAVLRFACYPTDERRAIDWDIYSHLRCWWTTIAELDDLRENQRFL